jgi:hypothetical protein
MTPRRESYADADYFLDRLREDIADGGGTGRRLSKMQWLLGWYEEDEPRVGAAVRELIERGDIVIDEPLQGFLYAVPVER